VEWVVGAAAVAVILVVVIVAWMQVRGMKARLAAANAAQDESRRTAEHLETRVATLRQELAEQHRVNAELTAKLRSAGDARAAGLWALERLRQARLAGTPSLPTTTGPGIDLGSDLRDAIALELELMREEVGTYAEVTSVDLGDPVSPREALAVFRVVQELAAALAKRADELAVTIERDGDAARVTVRASGWTSEGTPNHANLERCVAALDGTLALLPEPDVLVAEVHIPDRAS
jgi:hypothetical protein